MIFTVFETTSDLKKKKYAWIIQEQKNRGTWRVFHRSVFSSYDFMLLKRSWCRNIILLTIANRFKCCSIRCQSFGNFQGLSTLRLECNVTIRHLESSAFQQVDVFVLAGVSSLQACSQHQNSASTVFAFVYLQQVVFIILANTGVISGYTDTTAGLFLTVLYAMNEFPTRGMTVSLIRITELCNHSWRTLCT